MKSSISIRAAKREETGQILEFIMELARYEKLEHEVIGTAEQLERDLFGPEACAEVIFLCWDEAPVGFALFFRNYSTFRTQPGLYLEDLFVRPEFRGKGLGKAAMTYLAQLAVERGYGRFDWAVLDWNEPSIQFYKTMGAKHMLDWRGMRLEGEALQKAASRI